MDSHRILVVGDVSPLESHGGAGRVMREQSRGLAARGHAVTVFCRHPGAGLPLAGAVDGVPVIHYGVDRTNPLTFALTSLAGARRGIRDLGHRDWDTVIFHQPFSAAALGSLLPARARRIYVFHSPAGAEYRVRAERPDRRRPTAGARVVGMLLAHLERRALRAAARIVVLSEFSRETLARTHPALPAPVSVVAGAVDVERFRPAADRAPVRQRLGIPEAAILLLTVRDLQPRMGLDALLEALPAMRGARPLVCLIGGSGALRPALERLAAGLGLEDVVRFAGHIAEETLPLHYQAADLFVLPTRALEGFGLVTVEALASGTPVVATPVGATPEILAPLDSRLLATDTSPRALAAAVLAALPLAADEAFRRRCRRHAETHYTWRRHLDLLEPLVTGGSRVGAGRP